MKPPRNKTVMLRMTRTVKGSYLLAFATLLTLLPSTSGVLYGLRDDQYPSVVHVEISGDNRNVPGCCPRCTGVLISLKHVVTVASCLWSVQDTLPKPNDIEVYAGTSEVSGKIYNDNDPQWGYGACSRTVQHVQALDVIYHKKFHPQFFSLHQDIALIVIPKLEGNRFVQPIEMSFDTFDAANAVQQCKIVGFGILKFPRAGYFNLFTWLQPMTRWEREVTVKSGCMGKPTDWTKKKWSVMSQGSLCSTVFSSEARVCWNDRGAALVCNGFLAGIVQAQFEDEGKLDLMLRQCTDMDVPGSPRKERYQVIFFNMKFIAELIPEQMARTQDLQWSKYYFNRKDLGFDLNVSEPETENLSISTSTEPSTAIKEVYIQPKPIHYLTAEKKMKGPKDVKNQQSLSEMSLQESEESPRKQNEADRVPRRRKTTTPSTTTENVMAGHLKYEETPELELNLRTEDQDERISMFNTDNIEDIFNDNHPFKKSATNVYHLAILLNNHTQEACTGVFITPQSVLTGASCLVGKEENYQLVGFSNYRIITGHSNGLIDYCSNRIRMYSVQNVSIMNEGQRQNWQMYKKSRILPFTEIYNLAVLTIAGTYLSNTSYPIIDYDTWSPPPKPLPMTHLIEEMTEDRVPQSNTSTMQCTMFGYGHLNYPFTNQRDRIGIKALELEITENCSRPFFDYPFGEQSENLWIDQENPHFYCAVNLNSSLGPSTGSIGSPLYCGRNLVGLYIGRYNNQSFESSKLKHNPNAMYIHVFLKLDHYNEWITDVLLDETVVQMRMARLPPSQATPIRVLDMMFVIMCVILGVTEVYMRV
ncbi:hypothetical protein WDU94_011452 [Cyamophila willieti]